VSTIALCGCGTYLQQGRDANGTLHRCPWMDRWGTNMTDNERVRGLAETLYASAFQHEPIESDRYAKHFAAGILADQPTHAKALLAADFSVQVFLDAAVEAGELELWGHNDAQGAAYWLPPKPKPHVHEPYVAQMSGGGAGVVLRCRFSSCDQLRVVSAGLPIEWPEEG
jgi:hypothetical protein